MNNKLNVKLISMEDIVSAKCCNVSQVIQVIEKVLLDYKNGFVLLPEKTSQIFNDETQDRINCMPSTLLKEKICGVKWVSVFPENPCKYSSQNVSGVIVLSELKQGFPIAIMDGTLITALRTACVGAIGAKYLARQNSHIYGSIGSGEQAKAHFIAMKEVFPQIDTCYVASRTEKSEKRFVDTMKSRYHDVSFVTCDSDYNKAASNADILVTAVSCQKPLLKAAAIKPGTFYCHVGGWEDEYEVPRKADKIVCDDWNSLKHRGSPTIARMYEAGLLLDEDIYSSLADIIDGTKKGRETDEEFIYFNSIGLSFVDISVAYSFYKKIILKKEFVRDWRIQSTDVIDAMLSEKYNPLEMQESIVVPQNK